LAKDKNINADLPEGKWFRQPSNQVHKDKKKYDRKKKNWKKDLDA